MYSQAAVVLLGGFIACFTIKAYVIIRFLELHNLRPAWFCYLLVASVSF